MDYNSTEIKRFLERYQELRSLAEQDSLYFEKSSADIGKSHYGLEDIICTLVDIDNAMSSLTPRQRDVVVMLKEGKNAKAISHALRISTATFKFHLHAAVTRITTYLNS